MNKFSKKSQSPVYLSLSNEEWEEKLQVSRKLASPCILCGRRCCAMRFKMYTNTENIDNIEMCTNTENIDNIEMYANAENIDNIQTIDIEPNKNIDTKNIDKNTKNIDKTKNNGTTRNNGTTKQNNATTYTQNNTSSSAQNNTMTNMQNTENTAENITENITQPPISSMGSSKESPIGICKTRDKAIVASWGPHFGEEPPLVGKRGSGTIFFSGCNLKCIFCQNYDIAHFHLGQEVSDEKLCEIMLELQELGCHNVNLVSPTHVVPNILAAVRLAAKQGLRIPLVYNTGGYDSLETIRLLEGVVDIYMPDMKYGDPEPAKDFSKADNYPEINFAAVKEMHRQVGDLVIGEDNVAIRGLLVRHLVLPGGLAGTKKIMEFIANNISKNTYVNIMAQYRPYYKAIGHPQLGRRIRASEYREALKIAADAGLTRIQAF